MKEKIKELEDLLLGKQIVHKTKFGLKKYNVKNVVERASNIVIETLERKTFVETINSIDSLLLEIKIIDDSVSENKILNLEKSNENKVEKVMYKAPEETNSISDGLMSIFKDLTSTNHLSEEKLKRAKLACDVAGKIIDNERVKLGYLALNYR